MRATEATIRARVDDILRVLLDGAQPWDIRQYVADQVAKGEPPWTVPDGGKPLSERQIRRYCDRADKLIAESCRTNRKKLLRRHLAQLRALSARAVASGQLGVARAIKRDEAELLDLYPAAKVKAQHSGPKGGPIPIIAVEAVKPPDADAVDGEND
jgi:hypothetical protein